MFLTVFPPLQAVIKKPTSYHNTVDKMGLILCNVLCLNVNYCTYFYDHPNSHPPFKLFSSSFPLLRKKSCVTWVNGEPKVFFLWMLYVCKCNKAFYSGLCWSQHGILLAFTPTSILTWSFQISCLVKFLIGLGQNFDLRFMMKFAFLNDSARLWFSVTKEYTVHKKEVFLLIGYQIHP